MKTHEFKFKDLTIRAVEIEGEPWFLAADVCRALSVYIRRDGTPNTNSATRKLSPDERRLISYLEANRIGLQQAASRAHGILLVSESGLYKLIMRSDKPEAKAFQDWVTREVLPAIRKTGGYLLNEEARDTAHADDRTAMPMPEGLGAHIEVRRRSPVARFPNGV